MSLAVNVPLNTILADLDESLKALLKGELDRHGFDNIDISFDAPSNQWSSKLSKPTVNVFLYDLKESLERRQMQMNVQKTNGRVLEARPPLLLECTYAITPWSQAVQDEHRLLSQLLAILHSYPNLPTNLPGLSSTDQRFPLEGNVGAAKEGKANFWNLINGQFKVSIDYEVLISIDSGSVLKRGPEVRTRSIRTRMSDGPPSTIAELHGIGGTVSDPTGDLIANVWVVLPHQGLWTATDQNGYFVFKHVSPGKHPYYLRTPDGQSSEGEIEVPGKKTDLTIGNKVEVSRK